MSLDNESIENRSEYFQEETSELEVNNDIETKNNPKNIVEHTTISNMGEKAKKATNDIATHIAKNIGVKIAQGLLALILLVAGYWVIKSNLFNWGFSFFNSELKIDKTANVVEQVKKISEITTMNYYDEAVLKKERLAGPNSTVMNFFNVKTDSIHEEIVMIAKGKVRAGFDLSKIAEKDIEVSGDTISIKLPSPEILDVIANPTDFEIFVEEGKWDHEVIAALQMEHREVLQKRAMDMNILDGALKSGKDKITTLFKSFGFNVVNVEIGN